MLILSLPLEVQNFQIPGIKLIDSRNLLICILLKGLLMKYNTHSCLCKFRALDRGVKEWTKYPTSTQNINSYSKFYPEANRTELEWSKRCGKRSIYRPSTHHIGFSLQVYTVSRCGTFFIPANIVTWRKVLYCLFLFLI